MARATLLEKEQQASLKRPEHLDQRIRFITKLASWELGDEIGGMAVGDVDHVEAQLFCGSSRRLSLGMGKPGRVGPVIIAEVKHDDFGGGATIGLLESKKGPTAPLGSVSLTTATVRPSLPRWRRGMFVREPDWLDARADQCPLCLR